MTQKKQILPVAIMIHCLVYAVLLNASLLFFSFYGSTPPRYFYVSQVHCMIFVLAGIALAWGNVSRKKKHVLRLLFR